MRPDQYQFWCSAWMLLLYVVTACVVFLLMAWAVHKVSE